MAAIKLNTRTRLVAGFGLMIALMIGLTISDLTLGTLVANLGYDTLVMPKPVCIGATMRAPTSIVHDASPSCASRTRTDPRRIGT